LPQRREHLRYTKTSSVRSTLFWDVTGRRMVVTLFTDVSVYPISSIFKGSKNPKKKN